MGRISRYQVQQLASSAVGVPQQDRSGQIIADGLSSLVNAGAKVLGEREKEKTLAAKALAVLEDKREKEKTLAAKALAVLEDKRTSAEALARYRDYEVEYERVRQGAKENAGNDPDRFMALMDQATDGLKAKYLKGLDDTTARKLDVNINDHASAQTIQNIKWSADRKRDILVSNLDATRYKSALTASGISDPAEYRGYLESSIRQSSELEQGLLLEGDIIKNNENMKRTAFELRAANAIGTNPAAFVDAASRGEFAGIAPEDLVQSFVVKANNAIPEWRMRNQLSNALAASSEVQGFMDSIIETGDAPFVQALAAKKYIDVRKATAKADKTGKMHVPENYERALNTIIENQNMKIVSGKTTAGLKEDYATKIRTFFKTKRSPETSESVSAGDNLRVLDNMIGIYADAMDDLGKGRLSINDFEEIHGLLNSFSGGERGLNKGMDKVIQSVRNTKWWKNVRTHFDVAVEKLEENLDKRNIKGNDVFVAYMTKYREVFDSLPDAQKQRIMESSDKKRYVSKLMFGTQKDIEESLGLKGVLSVRQRVENITNPYTGEAVELDQAVTLKDGSIATVVGVDDEGYAVIKRSGASYIKALGNTPR